MVEQKFDEVTEIIRLEMDIRQWLLKILEDVEERLKLYREDRDWAKHVLVGHTFDERRRAEWEEFWKNNPTHTPYSEKEREIMKNHFILERERGKWWEVEWNRKLGIAEKNIALAERKSVLLRSLDVHLIPRENKDETRQIFDGKEDKEKPKAVNDALFEEHLNELKHI